MTASYITLGRFEFKAVVKESVGQSLGRKDINGTPVFAGDIVKFREPATPRQQSPDWIVLEIEYVIESASFRAVRDYDGERPIHDDVLMR